MPPAPKVALGAQAASPYLAPMTDLAAYFARIGHDGPTAPTLDTLRALHERHPASIPFEAIDVLLDRGVDISPAAVDAKLIDGRRGGYCFEHNSLFRRVLTELGFEVTGLAARVRWNQPDEAPLQPRTHQVLRVELDGTSWLVDVGFGGAVMTAPLRLEPDTVQSTDHDDYRLVPIDPAQGGGLALQMRRDAGWIPVYDLSLTPCAPADYEMANWFTSTHPTSIFRNVVMVAKTAPDARHGLLFNRLSTRPRGGETTVTTLDAPGIESALRDIFGLPVEPSWRPVIERAATHEW